MKHRRSFSVLGVQSKVKRGSETSELFANIWEKFELQKDVLESLSLRKQYYGVSFPTDKEDVSDYLAGMMVSDDSPVPNGLVKRRVLGSDYAVFECPVEGIGECYQNIFTKWLPAAPVNFNPKNPVFEEYPEKNSTRPVRIHIPVTKYEKANRSAG